MATFDFSALPRELRDLIYTYVLAGGNTGILRLFKRVNEEASLLLYAAAFCRFCVFGGRKGYSRLYGQLNFVGPAQLDERSQRSIKNLRFEWVKSATPFPRLSGNEAEEAYEFVWDPNPPRNICDITLRLDYLETHYFTNDETGFFKRLAGFRTVSVNIALRTQNEYGLKAYPHGKSPYRWIRGLYEAIEKVLGPADDVEIELASLISRGYDQSAFTRFIFHPRRS